MRLPFHLRLVTWLVLLSYLNVLCPVTMLRADTTPPATLEAPNHPLAQRPIPSHIAPQTGTLTWSFSATPTDTDIFRAHILPEPLVPVGKATNAEENISLAQAITKYKQSASDDLTPFTGFLVQYPNSAWAASLHLNLGLRFFATAWFSEAFTEYSTAWTLSKNATDPHGRAIGDRAIGELLELNARVGRVDALEKLFAEIKGRPIRGSAAGLVVAAHEGLWLMQHHPDRAFRCGPGALDRILAHQNKTLGLDATIMACPSTKQGTSLAQLLKLARRVGLDYQMAKRTPGAAVIAPAVINWKVGHFAALLSFDRGVGRLEDPTFGKNSYTAAVAALDAEASGYFLVPAGPLPPGWRPVGEAEGATVWGKGALAQFDGSRTRCYDNQTCSAGGGCGCHGMTVANATLMVCSLHLTDTPLFYTPPVGPAVAFTLTYNQREMSQPATFDFGNIGNQWTYSWLSYVEEDQSGSTGNYTFTPTVHLMGGGTEPYPSAVSNTAPLASYGPQNQVDSHAQLSKTGGVYTQINPDGSSYVYGYLIGSNYFLTRIADPAGNALTLTYEADHSGRLNTVTDAVGQTTQIYYVSNASTNPGFYLIDHVTTGTAPYARTCKLGYTANGQLSSVTDVMGITSSFGYEQNEDFINSLTTPYSQTTPLQTSTFAWDDSSTKDDAANRTLTLTDPLGNIEEVESALTLFSTIPPNGVQPDPSRMMTSTADAAECNTFYWDKRAYSPSLNVNDAHTYHWLRMSTSPTVASGVLENEKSTLEANRIWYNYPGQTSTTTNATGTSDGPTAIGRVLDDGVTSQIYQYAYNSFGKVTSTTDPNGRVTIYTYDTTNGIDLMEVDRTTSTGHDVLAKFTYNTPTTTPPGPLHVPLTATDASGQTTQYGYNSAGQVTSITDPQGHTTNFYYDPTGQANTSNPASTGFLVSMVGPAVNSPTGPVTTFTYDPYDRIHTVTYFATDSQNSYTLTLGYDALNRPTSVTYPDQTSTQYVYTNLDLTQQVDRRGRITTYSYNALRQLVETIDPLDRHTFYGWCGCGDLNSISSAVGGTNDFDYDTTIFTYDLQGRLTGKFYPDNTSLTYTYENTTSRLKSVTDALNQVTNYSYNVDNSLNQVSYTDTSGNPLATPTVNFFYDPNYLRLTSMTDSDSVHLTNGAPTLLDTTSYHYNPVPAAPIITPTTGANQLHTVSFAGSTLNDTITYGYDELGRATSTSIDTGNTSSVFYDALGRVQTATNPLGTFNYGYVNQTDRLNQVAYPNGQITAYGYYPSSATTPGNDDQRLQTISNYALNAQHSAYVNLSSFGYAYDPEGIITTWAQQFDTNAVRYLTYNYDLADQLTAAVMPPITSTGSTTSYNYVYDKAGNRLSEQVNSAITGATVNNLNQITQLSDSGPVPFAGSVNEPATVTVNGLAAKTAPDASNPNQTDFSANITLSPGTDTVAVAATNGNSVTTTKNYTVNVTDSGVNRTLTYDANGNLTNDGNGKTYTFDAANRMVSCTQTVNSVQTVTGFVYDGFGRRVQQTSNGTLVKQWVWCGGAQPCEERDANNNVTKRFYSQGEQINGTNYYYTFDHLGSVREMTNSAGSLIARYDYDPFGRRTLVSGTDLADFGFTGFYHDQATNLDYSRTRPYTADLARWIGQDPIGEAGGINLYEYVGNNPINGVDPTGHFTLVEGGAAVVVAAITVAVIGTYLLLHPPKFQMPISSGGTCPVNLPTQTQTPVTPQLPQQEPFPWDPTYNPYEPLIFPDSSDWNIPYRNDAAKAPGKPTADDGYVPAKNWDGEKVRNPNGAGAGYPDENGHVWVPTGEGPLAHGGPHWDVQNPNGGYRNVYPGGKVR